MEFNRNENSERNSYFAMMVVDWRNFEIESLLVAVFDCQLLVYWDFGRLNHR